MVAVVAAREVVGCAPGTGNHERWTLRPYGGTANENWNECQEPSGPHSNAPGRGQTDFLQAREKQPY